MTVGDIKERIAGRADDSALTPVTVSDVELLAAINEGQQLSGLLTLFLEKTDNLTITGCWQRVRPTLTDFLVPLRLSIAGVRLRPATLTELDAENTAWQNASGTAARYFMAGFDLLAVTPEQLATARMTYAASPTILTSDGQTPQLPAEYHQDLVNYGIYRVRLKEGAQSLQRGLGYLDRFLDDMTRLGNYVRARSAAARYDTMPFELALFDRSRLIKEVVAWQAKSTAKQ